MLRRALFCLAVCALTPGWAMAAVETATAPATRPATPEEIDALLAQSRDSDPKRQANAAAQLARLIVARKIPHDEPRVLAAMKALLLRGHADASHEAMWALRWMGMRAFDAGLAAVQSDNAIAQNYGAALLGALAKEHPREQDKFAPAIAEVAKLLKFDDATVRTSAVTALGQMGPKAIPPLVTVLLDWPNDGAKGHPGMAAENALIAMGKPVVPAMVEALGSKDWHVRAEGAYILSRIPPGDGKDALAALLKATHDEHPQVQNNAGHALGRIGPEARSAASRIIEMIEEGNGSLPQALVFITLPPERVERSIKLFTKLEELVVQKRIEESRLYVLAQAIATAGAPAIPPLIAALASDDAAIRRGSAWALGQLGPKAAPAVPALAKMLEEKKPNGAIAAEALGQIGPAANAAVPALIGCLSKDRWANPISDRILIHDSPAARALGLIGKPAVPVLLRGIKSDDPLVQAGCAQALAVAGKDSEKEVVPALLTLLGGDRNSTVKGIAIGALVQLKADKAVLVPALGVVAEDSKDPRAAYWARSALTALKKDAPPNQQK